MKKTLIAEFFTTISKNHFSKSLAFMTYKSYQIRNWKWVSKIENKILDYLNLHDSKIISFYNARSALFHGLKMIWIKKDDEIIVNWYTCISVINSVIQAKATPIYAEIDKKTLSIDYELLESKVTEKTKAIIIQHTFWKSANIKKIKEIAQNHNLLIIEDCAHSLWSKFDDLKHGSFWDLAIFSTGRDKVISGVNGWFLVINNEEYFKKIDKIKESLIDLPLKTIYQNLFYNVVWFLSLRTYRFFWLWKMIIFTARKLHLINEILEKKEKQCDNNNLYYKLPNSLATLALDDLHLIFFYQKDREEISLYYEQNLDSNYFKSAFVEWKNEVLNYFRYPIIFKSKETKDEFYNYMKSYKVILWNSWSDTNIAPIWSNLEKAKYTWDCLLSEEIASKILFLPNNKNIKLKHAKIIVKLANNFNKWIS